MAKKEFKIKMITNNSTENYSIIGDLDEENQMISYLEEDSFHTKMRLDLKNKVLMRENDMVMIETPLYENKISTGSVFMKEFNQTLNLKILTHQLKIEKNQIFIEYTVVDNDERIIYELTF